MGIDGWKLKAKKAQARVRELEAWRDDRSILIGWLVEDLREARTQAKTAEAELARLQARGPVDPLKEVDEAMRRITEAMPTARDIEDAVGTADPMSRPFPIRERVLIRLTCGYSAVVLASNVKSAILRVQADAVETMGATGTDLDVEEVERVDAVGIAPRTPSRLSAPPRALGEAKRAGPSWVEAARASNELRTTSSRNQQSHVAVVISLTGPKYGTKRSETM